MRRIGEQTLMAYADGALNGLRSDEVERALAEDPRLRERLELDRRMRACLAAHYAAVMEEPMPERLMEAVTRQRAQPRTMLDRWTIAAAVAVASAAAMAAAALL